MTELIHQAVFNIQSDFSKVKQIKGAQAYNHKFLDLPTINVYGAGFLNKHKCYMIDSIEVCPTTNSEVVVTTIYAMDGSFKMSQCYISGFQGLLKKGNVMQDRFAAVTTSRRINRIALYNLAPHDNDANVEYIQERLIKAVENRENNAPENVTTAEMKVIDLEEIETSNAPF